MMKKTLMSNGGFVTTEFLFAIVIAFGMTSLVFAVTFTLSVVETTQYVVFSAARAQSASNLNPDSQTAAARAKYESLVSHPALAPLFQNGWFSVSPANQLEVRNSQNADFSRDYPTNTPRQVFQGVRTVFKADVLEMRLPFIGSVTPDGDGFSTRIGAFLIRESSQSECISFMRQRVEALWGLGDGRMAKFKGSGSVDVPWEDNGC